MQIYPVANARHHMVIFIYFTSMMFSNNRAHSDSRSPNADIDDLSRTKDGRMYSDHLRTMHHSWHMGLATDSKMSKNYTYLLVMPNQSSN